jgi:hypothetical protein
MFGLFKKKSKSDMLKKKYEKLLEESYKLSHTDRTASSLKAAEADEVLKEMEKLNSQSE